MVLTIPSHGSLPLQPNRDDPGLCAAEGVTSRRKIEGQGGNNSRLLGLAFSVFQCQVIILDEADSMTQAAQQARNCCVD